LWGVRPRNKGKGLPFFATKARRVRTEAVHHWGVEKKIVWGMW